MITVKRTQMVETAAGRGVEIRAVIDRGSGIEPKNRENIFNPFFTTKSEVSGVGPGRLFPRSSTSMEAASRSKARPGKAAYSK